MWETERHAENEAVRLILELLVLSKKASCEVEIGGWHVSFNILL